MRQHKYTKHRPEWCNHPPFESIDYCWGLACEVDDNKVEEFKEKSCKKCEFNGKTWGEWKKREEK